MKALIPLLLGAWLTALFWPYAHAGGYLHPAILALTPLLLSTAELWPHWALRVLHWAMVLWGELALAWNVAAPWHLLGQVIGGGVRKLLELPIQDWNQLSAHLAAPLILAGGFLGWLLFRQCRGYRQAIALAVLGAFIIAVNHVFWQLPGNGPLAAYLLLSGAILAVFHNQRLAAGAYRLPRPKTHYVLWGVALAAPVAIGFQMPAQAATDPLGLFSGASVLARLSGGGTAITGYGAGVTNIGHSLTASRAPVFIAKTAKPEYWQAAIYTHFNGSSWSNTGPVSSYDAIPSNESSLLPLIAAPFAGSLMTETVHATIVDASSTPLTTLFYAGTPTKFSVEATVHPRSERFRAQGVSRYSLSALMPDYGATGLATTPFTSPPPGLAADLQIPANESPQVKKLALRVTRGTVGPWQAANAIKHYLDTHYRYSYHVTPASGNVVNHFLFVDRQGYCDQFSTTFIMMMRALKVPARWVVGYAPGTWDPTKHGYMVRAVDAHSWAEIWIKGQGWVPFDPTPGFHFTLNTVSPAGQRPIITPAGVLSHPTNTAKPPNLKPAAAPHIHHPGGPSGVTVTKQHRAKPKVALLVRLTVAAIVAAIILAGIGLARWKNRLPLEAKIWRQMQGHAHRKLGIRVPIAQSPRQWGKAWVRYFPEDAQEVWPMVLLMEAAFYRHKPLDARERETLHSLWMELKRSRRRGA
ncbi:transglutaminaseTgpA domain-containing protein [Sulfobacillus harzensis]|uniref:Transglutaminase domain-containing protein n=1 Tax=Sulfobacillus harzensis TaxID=2729629 RepID=A0A7Y0Q3G8_9FIRM|nr:transglutaminase domain-containing protein [Sulfobacillus harzensis]NMP22174.1 transglutaminase domain-containing protein [Sulfobacillus harzensis]